MVSTRPFPAAPTEYGSGGVGKDTLRDGHSPLQASGANDMTPNEVIHTVWEGRPQN